MISSKNELSERNGWMGYWPKEGWKGILDPENGRIRMFLIEEAKKLTHGALILDAGAGKRPYKDIFLKFNYESCDMPGGFYSENHNFECDLSDIPKPDNSYDVVVLTQVLEHVPSPKDVLSEINRILKKDGRLLISVPLNGPLHGEPWHFYHFTHYGISELAKSCNYNIISVEKIGGSFWSLGKRIPDSFRKLFKQFDPFRAKKRNQSIHFCIAMNVLLLPIYILAYLPSAYIVRPLFYWLDKLDHEKKYTLGYTIVLGKLN